MNITEKIKKTEKYFKQFNVLKDCAYILLDLPDNWALPNDDFLKKEFNVNVTVDDNGIYFFSEVNELDKVFEAAFYTIDMNKTNEAKLALYNEKIEELQNIFAERNLEELKTISFSFKTSNNGNDGIKGRNRVNVASQSFINKDEINEKTEKTNEIDKVIENEVKENIKKEKSNEKQNNKSLPQDNRMNIAKTLVGE